MRLRNLHRISAALVGTALVCVLGGTTALAAGNAPSADDCGFSLLHQSYRNCTPGTEVVEITYVTQPPKGVGYVKIRYCIPFGRQKAVVRPDGMLAEGGVVMPSQKCTDSGVSKA